MLSLTFTLLTWVAHCLATATPKCTSFTDKYDARTISNTVPLVEDVGVQNGIQYNTFKYLNGNSPLFGVRPQSSPNIIGGALVGNIAAGQLQLTASGTIVGTDATPYFDLESLYYGCYVYEGPQTFVTLASACTLAVAGYDYQDRQVVAQGLAFSPSATIGSKSPMNYQTFDKFIKMKNVTIGVVTASPVTALGVLVMDNIKHCNYAS